MIFYFLFNNINELSAVVVLLPLLSVVRDRHVKTELLCSGRSDIAKI